MERRRRFLTCQITRCEVAQPLETMTIRGRWFMENTTLRRLVRLTIACDDYRHGLHFDWAGMEAALQVDVLGQWICGECLIVAVPCDLWPLGLKSKPARLHHDSGYRRQFKVDIHF